MNYSEEVLPEQQPGNYEEREREGDKQDSDEFEEGYVLLDCPRCGSVHKRPACKE